MKKIWGNYLDWEESFLSHRGLWVSLGLALVVTLCAITDALSYILWVGIVTIGIFMFGVAIALWVGGGSILKREIYNRGQAYKAALGEDALYAVDSEYGQDYGAQRRYDDSHDGDWGYQRGTVK